MKLVVLYTLAGVGIAPLGALVGLFGLYAILWWRGVSEAEGKRGLSAFLYGFLPGAAVGFYLGGALARQLAQRPSRRAGDEHHSRH